MLFCQKPSTCSGAIVVTNFTRDLGLTLTLGPYDLNDRNVIYAC